MTTTRRPHKTAARLAALLAADEGRLSYEGRGLGGRYHVELKGMGGETTTSVYLQDAVKLLLEQDYVAHSAPGVPLRSGAVHLTDTGRTLLAIWTDGN
jgi:hypothetical protein